MSEQSRAKMSAALLVMVCTSGIACFGGDEPLVDLFKTGGNSEEGYFAIKPEPSVALAVGSKMDWRVGDYEGPIHVSKSAKPRNVKISDPEIVGLDGASGELITVTGKAEGVVSVSFDGDADGEKTRDSFKVRSATPTSLRFQPCDGVYVRGEPAYVPFSFGTGSGGDAYGYGRYPVMIEPSTGGLINLENRDPYAMRVDIAEDAGDSITLRSTLEGDSSQTTLRLIDRSEITRIEVNHAEELDHELDTVNELTLDVWAGEQRVCSALQVELKVETPSVCQLFVGNDGVARKEVTTFMHGVGLRGLEAGSACRVSIVVLTALAAAVVRELRADITVHDASSGGGSDFD